MAAGARYFFSSMSGETFYRRRMPHWRSSGVVYFVTWRLAPRQDELTATERDVVVSALRRFDTIRYVLDAFVVMNDHVHVLVRDLKNDLEEIVRNWKSFTANRLQRAHGRSGSIWQEEYFDRIVRDEKEFGDKLRYVQNNPVKRWPGTKAYRWIWVREG